MAAGISPYTTDGAAHSQIAWEIDSDLAHSSHVHVMLHPHTACRAISLRVKCCCSDEMQLEASSCRSIYRYVSASDGSRAVALGHAEVHCHQGHVHGCQRGPVHRGAEGG